MKMDFDDSGVKGNRRVKSSGKSKVEAKARWQEDGNPTCVSLMSGISLSFKRRKHILSTITKKNYNPKPDPPFYGHRPLSLGLY